MKFRAVLGGEGHIGKHVLFRRVHERGQLRKFGPHLVDHETPLGFRCGVSWSGWAKAVAMKAETTRRLLLPAWAKALR